MVSKTQKKWRAMAKCCRGAIKNCSRKSPTKKISTKSKMLLFLVINTNMFQMLYYQSINNFFSFRGFFYWFCFLSQHFSNFALKFTHIPNGTSTKVISYWKTHQNLIKINLKTRQKNRFFLKNRENNCTGSYQAGGFETYTP